MQQLDPALRMEQHDKYKAIQEEQAQLVDANYNVGPAKHPKPAWMLGFVGETRW